MPRARWHSGLGCANAFDHWLAGASSEHESQPDPAAAAGRRRLAGCKPENKFQPPPPPEISVAVPLQQEVTPFEELTGNTVAFATVDLVARVEGFLTAINYIDGALVKKGDTALPDRADDVQGQGQGGRGRARLGQGPAGAGRRPSSPARRRCCARTSRRRTPTTGQGQARLRRAANVENHEGNLTIAQTNLGYTKVTAPFDGIVTKHLISVGELVGDGVATKLATIVQLDPIYVDVQHERAGRAEDPRQSRQAPPDARGARQGPARGRPDERGGLSAQGHPRLRLARRSIPRPARCWCAACSSNPNRDLLPGFFVRIRVPMGLGARRPRCWCPTASSPRTRPAATCWSSTRTTSSSSAASRSGQLLVGGLRVITERPQADDRVVIGDQRPGDPGRQGRRPEDDDRRRRRPRQRHDVTAAGSAADDLRNSSSSGRCWPMCWRSSSC